MKSENKILKTIKVPLKLIHKVGSIPLKFVYSKQKKLIKIISPSNVKIIAVKIYRLGQKIIVTFAVIVSIISSSGIPNKKMIESSFTFSSKTPIERVLRVSNGGAINHPWSPLSRYETNTTKNSSSKAPRRRLLSVSRSRSNQRFNSGQNPGYQKPVPSLNDNQPKPGKGLRVRSIVTKDENGEMKTISYNQNGELINQLDESKLNNSPTSTDQHIQSETKNQAENAQNPNSRLMKARSHVTPVKTDKLTSDGDVRNRSELTSDGRNFVDKTKTRRAGPLFQSRYEDKDSKFSPVYGLGELQKKNEHTLEVLEKLGKNITRYNELSKGMQLEVDMTIVEGLLAHPDSELYMNVMAQGREPICLVLNRGEGSYPLPNHVSTFERRPEISEYNPYISNYVANKPQIKNFDLSNSTSITYEDLVGNSHTNIGPVFGQTAPPTSAPIVNDGNTEL